ncbi:MAG TPA: formylglycine-generating enzyme family protein [Candidatus Competibacter sp.]|nr:formylglycine-generating enzyme family protein [Candidatus Competibacter sp.]
MTGWNPLCAVRTLAWIFLLVLGFGSVPASAQEASAPPPTRPAMPTGISVAAEAEARATAAGTIDIPPLLPAVPCMNAPGLGPEMIVIEAGRFVMGSPSNEAGRLEREGPQREIVVVHPFTIARCETTVAEFRTFVVATGYVTQAEAGEGCTVLNEAGTDSEQRKDWNWRDPGFPQTDAHPVVCVSWNDAVAYAEWLSRRTGQPYRLPTEAEWEYAARAGSTASRFWGDDPNAGCDYANAADQALKRHYSESKGSFATCDDGTIYTAPVGHFQRNAFGLSDMLGNVWEWVRDYYADTLDSVPADGTAWEGPPGENGARRVVRGGGWYFDPEFVRSAYRNRLSSNGANIFLGFRLARDL